MPRERRETGVTGLINADTLCVEWDFSKRSLKRLIAEGQLEAFVMQKRLKITRASAEAYLARQKAEAAARAPQPGPRRREEPSAA